MIPNGSSLSTRRKRGTGLTERTNVSLSPRAFQLKEDNKINLSALVEKLILDKFGDINDPVIARMIVRRDELVAQIEELRQEVHALNAGIEARRAVQDELKSSEKPLPDGYPDMDSSEARNASFKSDLNGLKKTEDLL